MTGVTRAELLRGLMAVLWLLGLVRIFYLADWLAYIALALMLAYLTLAWPVCGRLNRIVTVIVVVLVILACTFEQRWEAILQGLVFALIFTAFLPTLQLMRATLDIGPEFACSREIFAQMPPNQRDDALVVGSNVIGSVMTMGALTMLSPLIPPGADENTRRTMAQAALRGLALTIFWSPFTVAMALATSFWPGQPLWRIMAIGLILTLLGVGVAVLMGGGNWRALLPSLSAFRPLLLPLGGTMITVVAAASFSPFGTIQTIILVVPMLCLLWILRHNRHEFRRVARATYQNLDRLGNELLLFCAAITLGRVLQESRLLHEVFEQAWLAQLPVSSVIILTLALGLGLALLGVHSVVIGTCIMLLLTPFHDRIADLVAIELMLYGWACASLLSLSALSVVLCSSLFQVSVPRLILGRNILFMALLGLLLLVFLWPVNVWLSGFQ